MTIPAIPIVPTLRNPTTKKCLPSRTLSIRGTWASSSGSRICIIFSKVCFNNNTSQAHSAHPRKSNYEKVPALESTFDRGHLGAI